MPEAFKDSIVSASLIARLVKKIFAVCSFSVALNILEILTSSQEFRSFCDRVISRRDCAWERASIVLWSVILVPFSSRK